MSDNGTPLERPRVVVVTGGSAGVGRAAVRAFAEAGDDVAILARGADGLEGARSDVEARGRRALAIPTDVADHAQVEAAARRVEEELGPIDVWVNNAMTTVFAPLWEITPEEYERATRVTYLGSVWGTMVALERFRARGRGVLVQVGSALAYRAIPLQAPYCGAKHATRGMIDALRSELIHEGLGDVHVTMVHLPGLNTPQFEWCRSRLPNHPQPVPPIYEPEVAADAIVWASKHRRREVMVGVPTLKTVWGQKFLPRFMDRYLADKAWEGQQMPSRPVAEDRPDNLFEPLAGDHGARGLFEARARETSVQLELSQRRRWVLAGAAVAALGLAVGLLRR